ncbi:ZnF C2H2 [Geosmithia morbida]|uniref:ZnF C2H2 n=1 Tax=Geosmithia morbida TaxID=1094350 RepID=A0A9P4YVZ8_9HYPO|nr:ZnF C2H2 [Geosmithia morbida]KAF4122039.1 ZnF C2H2 [Geosmithia morbida]
MAYPPQYAGAAPAVPNHIASAPTSHQNNDMPSYGSSHSMAIPGVEPHHTVPPPLPPPKYPFSGTTTTMPYPSSHGNNDDVLRGVHEHSRAPSSAGSAYGSSVASSFLDDRSRRRKSPTGSQDEGYHSLSSNERSLSSFPPRFVLHNSLSFQTAADAHGNDMKEKLNPLRTLDRSSLSSSSSFTNISADELLSRCTRHPLDPGVLPPKLTTDFPPISPRHAPYGRLSIDHRRPSKTGLDLDRSPRYRTYRNNSDDASSQGTYDYMVGADDMEIDEIPPPYKRLHVDDVYGSSGRKHGPTSPSSTTDETGSRLSPTARLASTATLPPPPQMPTASTMPALSRSDSYVSMSMGPSTTTTPTVYEHRSPGGGAYSPGGVSPTSGNSPYPTPMSLNPSPRGSISMRALPSAVHTRNHSSGNAAAAPKRLPELQKPAGAKVQSFIMCECCPKKPKRFETQEELQAHASEKQYNCAYCGNRFKNKNEAERHQNSLHVRRHSWSCSALQGYSRAFHESSTRPGETDACGYCGVNFDRSGVDAKGNRVATEQDWAERVHHLDDTHKFRECNSSKKFYRADHFRQHLKHSHAGSSGKWTNMLENACMMEEEPPTPQR